MNREGEIRRRDIFKVPKESDEMIDEPLDEADDKTTDVSSGLDEFLLEKRLVQEAEDLNWEHNRKKYKDKN